jgi:Tfp pilus assembly protein PilV
MNNAGISFIEIIIATAIFGILLAAILPLLNQAGRNMAYAQEGYDAHLAAQGIMHAVRDAVRAQGFSAAQTAAETRAASLGAETYAVFIFPQDASHISFGSACAPDTTVNLHGISNAVVTIVFRDENIAGRAIGAF